MEKKIPPPMTPFDELVTSPQLQDMKLLLPYTPASGQQMLAALIKFMELRQTLFLFHHFRSGIRAQLLRADEGNTQEDLLKSLRPYLSPQENETLDMVLNMKDIMSMAEMMKSATDSDSSGEGGPPFSPMDLMMGMLSPEQQESFNAYSAMFSQAADNVEKGEDDNGGMDERSGTENDRSDQT